MIDIFYGHRRRSQGSALIAVVAAIAIFSVLAAALLSMTSTSERQNVVSHLSDRAYYLAESGYRFAASRLPVAIDSLDGDYSLSSGNGSFSLNINSYYYIVSDISLPVDTTVIHVHSPGNFPDQEVTQM